MATFRFKFENVLEQRRMVEDERQRELARHMRTRMILQSQLEQMQGTIRQSKHELADALVGRVDLQRVAGFASYSGQSTERARQIVQRVALAERQIHEARSRLLDASRQRKAMELLRDRHERAWKQEQRRREAVMFDEVATQQYLRTMTIGGRG
ncbi:MAG: flagellar export protein FliJ [Phycisphaeraceae bacterium]